MNSKQSKKTSDILILAVTVFAFYSSYMHGVHMVSTHQPEGSPFGTDYGVAAIPEIVLIGSVLRGMDWKSIGAGSLSVLWTFWVNVSAAAGGASGLIVALVPPVAALILLGLSDHGSGIKAKSKARKDQGSRIKPEGSTAQKGSTANGSGVKSEGSQKPEKKVSTGGTRITKTDQGILWASAQNELPSVKEIMLAVPCAEATAKRIRAAVTAKTGSEESAVNS